MSDVSLSSHCDNGFTYDDVNGISTVGVKRFRYAEVLLQPSFQPAESSIHFQSNIKFDVINRVPIYVLLLLDVPDDCSHSPRQHYMHCYFGIGTPCDFSCGSHSGYVSRDMCRRSSLYGSCVFVRVLFRELFILSILHVTKPFNFPGSSGGTDIAAWRAWKARKSTLCGVFSR